MSQRVILITGANGGLGLAIAEAFLNEGSDRFVWLGIHHKRSDAENLASRFLGRVRTLELDVTDPRAWELAVDSISQTNQRLDVLINNAGFHADSLLGQMTFENWRRVLAVNLDGTFLGCQAALPLMISQRGGRIVNIASLSALAAPPGQTNYAAAKAGVVALTQSLAKEVARIGITVNAVCPGYTDTESLALMGSDARKAAVAKTPMRRFGKPEEVASAVRYLASPEASYITGSILKVDGGIL